MGRAARFKWNGGRAPWVVRSIIADGLEEAARSLAWHIRRSISTPYPPASEPGEPPHRRTGTLYRGVGSTVNRQTLVARIVVDRKVFYWKFLERGTSMMDPRPFVRPMVLKRRRITKETVAAAARRGFRRYSK